MELPLGTVGCRKKAGELGDTGFAMELVGGGCSCLRALWPLLVTQELRPVWVVTSVWPPKWSAPCGLGAEAKRAHRAQRTGAGVLLRTRATAARSTRQLRSEHAQDGGGEGTVSVKADSRQECAPWWDAGVTTQPKATAPCGAGLVPAGSDCLVWF